MNGNPGGIEDFIRTNISYTRPVFGSATFGPGWSDLYPTIQFYTTEATSTAPSRAGLVNYKPSSMQAYVAASGYRPELSFGLDNS
jgi:hypothetical protein